MGKLDDFAKSVFKEETSHLTGGACQWQGSREIQIGGHVLPDGFLLIAEAARLKLLPAPWSLIEDDEIVAEIKMAGDHMGPKQWYRGLLRRAARDVERCEAQDEGWVGYRPLWFVAPIVPEWIQKQHVVIPLDRGCSLVKGFPYPIVWVAANELPLVEELVPFLTARRGKPRRDFVRWVARRRPRPWVTRMLRVYKMSKAELQEHLKFFEAENKEDEEWNRMFGRQWLEKVVPEVRAEILEQGLEEGLLEGLKPLVHLYERRLSRALSDSERHALISRFSTLGPDRLGDVVFDLSAEELAAWLAANDAT